MIPLGLRKSTKGYGSAVSAYRREKKPLSKKMCQGLEVELAAAELEIALIREAIAGSSTTTKARRSRSNG